MLIGGFAFVASMAVRAVAGFFLALLSHRSPTTRRRGPFVGLTEAELMDGARRAPAADRRLGVAGSSAPSAGPLLVAVVVALGGGWRLASLAAGAAGAGAWSG